MRLMNAIILGMPLPSYSRLLLPAALRLHPCVYLSLVGRRHTSRVFSWVKKPLELFSTRMSSNLLLAVISGGICVPRCRRYRGSYLWNCHCLGLVRRTWISWSTKLESFSFGPLRQFASWGTVQRGTLTLSSRFYLACLSVPI